MMYSIVSISTGSGPQQPICLVSLSCRSFPCRFSPHPHLSQMSASSFPVKQKKFGLIPSKKKKKPAVAPARKQLSMFSSLEDDDDDDDDEGHGGDVNRANRELSRRAATSDMSLLDPDPDSADAKGGIYDYDGAYDDFKQEAVQKKTSLLSGSNKNTTMVCPKSPPIAITITITTSVIRSRVSLTVYCIT